jgi:CPA2 family monovalent cation:H+ antiporter-2
MPWPVLLLVVGRVAGVQEVAMHFPLFGELIVILGTGRRDPLAIPPKFKLPGILGFIVTGMIAGPHGVGWVEEVEEVVQAMAEIGVVIFLLFVIGMEFSLKKLAALGSYRVHRRPPASRA